MFTVKPNSHVEEDKVTLVYLSPIDLGKDTSTTYINVTVCKKIDNNKVCFYIKHKQQKENFLK